MPESSNQRVDLCITRWVQRGKWIAVSCSVNVSLLREFLHKGD
jgi:hypothetical protein